jgi:hypothetical protein
MTTSGVITRAAIRPTKETPAGIIKENYTVQPSDAMLVGVCLREPCQE